MTIDDIARAVEEIGARLAALETEEQGARIVKLEKRLADIERRVACLDSMADEHAKILAAPAGMFPVAMHFKPTPAEADVGIGGKP